MLTLQRLDGKCVLFTIATRYLDKLDFSNFVPTQVATPFMTCNSSESINNFFSRFQQFLNPNSDFQSLSECTIKGINFKPDNYYALKDGFFLNCFVQKFVFTKRSQWQR